MSTASNAAERRQRDAVANLLAQARARGIPCKPSHPSAFADCTPAEIANKVLEDTSLFSAAIDHLTAQDQEFSHDEIVSLAREFAHFKLDYVRHLEAIHTLLGMIRSPHTAYQVWLACPPLRRRILGFDYNEPVLALASLSPGELKTMLTEDKRHPSGRTPMGDEIHAQLTRSRRLGWSTAE